MKHFVIALYVMAFGLFAGWVMNIIALVHMIGGPVSSMFIARIVGVFAAPLGGVLGYM